MFWTRTRNIVKRFPSVGNLLALSTSDVASSVAETIVIPRPSLVATVSPGGIGFVRLWPTGIGVGVTVGVLVAVGSGVGVAVGA